MRVTCDKALLDRKCTPTCFFARAV